MPFSLSSKSRNMPGTRLKGPLTTILHVFAYALNKLGKARANIDDVFTALREVYARCHGAFACTAMIVGFGILGQI
jgi:hypothetical protein